MRTTGGASQEQGGLLSEYPQQDHGMAGADAGIAGWASTGAEWVSGGPVDLPPLT